MYVGYCRRQAENSAVFKRDLKETSEEADRRSGSREIPHRRDNCWKGAWCKIIMKWLLFLRTDELMMTGVVWPVDNLTTVRVGGGAVIVSEPNRTTLQRIRCLARGQGSERVSSNALADHDYIQYSSRKQVNNSVRIHGQRRILTPPKIKYRHPSTDGQK